MTDIVIIGAGLTGLSTAYYLEQMGFFDYQIFEKESEIGGLCRSIKQDGFTFDYTGHLIHVSDDNFKQFLTETISFEALNMLHRKSYIFSKNCYSHYPFQTNLHGLPLPIIADCIEGFIKRKKIKDPQTFYQWVMKHFGSGFAQHFFIPYQQKLFCYDLKKISASWTGRFVPQTSLESIIQGALHEPDDHIGYNALFYYPNQGGIHQLIHALARKLKNKIKTNYEVEKIDLEQRAVHFSHSEMVHYNKIINTMPLNMFLKKIKDKSSTNFQSQHHHLKANSVLNINIGINRPNLADYHWCYFPESHYPFYRMGFSHHFAQSMAPHNTSALYTECAYINKKPCTNDIIKQVKKFFDLKSSEIITVQELHIPQAYVIYNFWREKHLTSLVARLAENSIYSMGRYGSWKYSSMQESVLDGKQIAEKLLQVNLSRTKEMTVSR